MARANDLKGRFISELGLNVRETRSNLYSQRQLYIQMIRLAKEIDLPINVRCYSAHTEHLDLLRQERPPSRMESSMAFTKPSSI
jgi:Tat protein secretion system quality control protein TatD with DNase activity